MCLLAQTFAFREGAQPFPVFRRRVSRKHQPTHCLTSARLVTTQNKTNLEASVGRVTEASLGSDRENPRGCTDTLGGVSWFKFYVVIHLVPRQMQSSVSGSATTLIRGAATCAGEGGTGPLSSRGLYSRGRRWMNMTIQIVVSVLTTSQGRETGWQKVAGIRNWTGRAGSFRRLGRAYLPRKQ